MTLQTEATNDDVRALTTDELDAISGGRAALHNEISIGGYKMTIDANAQRYVVVVLEQ
jgi:hypothetical protein